MLLGAVAGVAASAIGRVGSYFERKQEIAAEERKRQDDMAMAKLQVDGQTAVADLNSYTALRAASYAQDAALGVPDTWVVDILRLVRPFITIYALFLETVLFFMTQDAEIKKLIVAAILETSAMTVTWWFGDRYKKDSK